MDSFMTGTPSKYFIDGVEESDLFLCDSVALQKIFEHIPSLAAGYQAGIQRHNAAKNQRIALSLSATAEERYEDFLKTYPSLAKRLPLQMIASYLGMAAETLSRVRNQLTHKN
jgi:CRP-like cAMP-binding protein